MGNSLLAPRPSGVKNGAILCIGRKNPDRWIAPLDGQYINGLNINGLNNNGVRVDEVIAKAGIVPTAVGECIAIPKAREAIGKAEVIGREAVVNADKRAGSRIKTIGAETGRVEGIITAKELSLRGRVRKQ